MLLVKKFAALCKCSTQTLGYYDKKGILKPVYIDKLSGYRYYEEERLFDFR